MKIELNRDWSEFLSALIAHRVKFVLVDGHAVAGHGELRLTEDLDVFVQPSLPNARRLREALADFGFGAVAPPVEDLATSDKIFMLGRKPWRIDILKPLFVIGREALIKNKRAAARPKDLSDVAALMALRKGTRGRRGRRPE